MLRNFLNSSYEKKEDDKSEKGKKNEKSEVRERERDRESEDIIILSIDN